MYFCGQVTQYVCTVCTLTAEGGTPHSATWPHASITHARTHTHARTLHQSLLALFLHTGCSIRYVCLPSGPLTVHALQVVRLGATTTSGLALYTASSASHEYTVRVVYWPCTIASVLLPTHTLSTATKHACTVEPV